MEPVRAVIFDIGGVVFRNENWEPQLRWEKRLGFPEGELSRIIFSSECQAKAVVGKVSEEEMWQDLLPHLRLEQTLLPEFLQDYWSGEELNRELFEFIQNMRPRCKTAFLSNAWSGARQSLNSRYHLCDAVDEVIFSCEVGLAKPDPQIYLLAAERLGVQPDEAVFVDDVLENVEAARATGMYAFQFRNTPETISTIQFYLGESPFPS